MKQSQTTNISKNKECHPSQALYLQAEAVIAIENQNDQHLLKTKNPALIYKYQYLVLHFIRKYTNAQTKGQQTIKEGLLFDLVISKLIEKLTTGKIQFDGNSLVKTLWYSVVRYTVLDILKSKEWKSHQREKNDKDTVLEWASSPPNYSADYALQYGTFLKMLLPDSSERCKFEFCIQVYYRTPFTQASLNALYPACPAELSAAILYHFGQPYSAMSQGQLWKLLLHFVIALEDKKQGIRSLQNWIDDILKAIAERIVQRPLPLDTPEKRKAVKAFFRHLVYGHYEGRMVNP